MNEAERKLWEQIVKEEQERVLAQPPAPPIPPKLPQRIHYTKLGPLMDDGPLTQEWNVYRREVGRLLAEGYEGKWVLIKGEEIIGLWETQQEATKAAVERYQLQPLLIQQVLTWEPVLRTPSFFQRYQCHN